jgi:hypothetical protein
MPAGGTALGFAYFAVSKFLGYTAFCRWVIEPRLLASAVSTASASTLLPPEDDLSVNFPSAFQAGAARTLIGILAGSLAGLLFFSGIPGLNNESNWPTIIFFALLIPIRIGEWWFLLWWMYRDFPTLPDTRGRLITFGILVSFALDAIGILAAFLMPGGIWIC